MVSRQIVLAGITVVGIISSASPLYGQTYPSRPIRILTYEPGGNADQSTRVIAQAIAPALGQPVVVDNRPINIAIQTALNANPDGYTLLYGGSSLTLQPLMRKTFFDPLEDFYPVSMLSGEASLIASNPSLPVSSVKELIALAKAKPGDLMYSSNGIGGGSHLATALFASMAGINVLHVPYKSSGLAVTDLVAGRVQFRIASPNALLQFIKSGKLKGLATTGPHPAAIAPSLPTAAASGLPGYTWTSESGIYTRAGTPSAVINLLYRQIQRELVNPAVKQIFMEGGGEIITETPAETYTRSKVESARLGKVIKDAGIYNSE